MSGPSNQWCQPHDDERKYNSGPLDSSFTMTTPPNNVDDLVLAWYASNGEAVVTPDGWPPAPASWCSGDVPPADWAPPSNSMLQWIGQSGNMGLWQPEWPLRDGFLPPEPCSPYAITDLSSANLGLYTTMPEDSNRERQVFFPSSSRNSSIRSTTRPSSSILVEPHVTPASTAGSASPTPTKSLSPAGSVMLVAETGTVQKTKHRVKNRAAAKRHRDKTRQSEIDLAMREKLLVQERARLSAGANSLQEEVLLLKQLILQHGNCNSQIIQGYITRTANELNATSPPTTTAHSASRQTEKASESRNTNHRR